MKNFKLLSVIIPVYNEESTIVETLQKLDNIPITSIQVEVIIVDDCSQDSTFEKIKNFLDTYQGNTQFVSLQHKVNQGKGRALKTGFARATGDILIIQDADLE